MKLYKDHHDEPHYHLGGGRHHEPKAQNKIFSRIIDDLEGSLPEDLSLRKNDSRSYNVVDERGRSYLHLSLYKQYGKWRVKIQVYPRGEGFFENQFKSLIDNIPSDYYQS